MARRLTDKKHQTSRNFETVVTSGQLKRSLVCWKTPKKFRKIAFGATNLNFAAASSSHLATLLLHYFSSSKMDSALDSRFDFFADCLRSTFDRKKDCCWDFDSRIHRKLRNDHIHGNEKSCSGRTGTRCPNAETGSSSVTMMWVAWNQIKVIGEQDDIISPPLELTAWQSSTKIHLMNKPLTTALNNYKPL